jgi:hypothetical protein
MQPLIRHEPGLDTPEKDEAETIAGIDVALPEILETARFSRIRLAAHRPLGSANRARRPVCGVSAHLAARINGCLVHEPADARLPG